MTLADHVANPRYPPQVMLLEAGFADLSLVLGKRPSQVQMGNREQESPAPQLETSLVG